MDYIGSHMSVAGGYLMAWERLQLVQGQALQIFTKNNLQWKASPIPPDEAKAFRVHSAQQKHPVCGHASYLINLGAINPVTLKQSCESLIHEIERAEQLGLPSLVLHPGNHMGAGEAEGIKSIAHNLRNALDATADHKVKIALETTAGQGTCMGHRLEHLEALFEAVDRPKRIGFCFDTCHVFAAGYDLSKPEGFDSTLLEFDRRLGLEKILVFHFNDSKTGLGSRVDRHEHIGKGHIGLHPFREILNHPSFSSVPKILETPKDTAGQNDRNNLKLLRSLVKKTA